MQIYVTRPDGVHILSKATLQQIANDELISVFAEGLITKALAGSMSTEIRGLTLAEALHQPDLPQLQPLLTALLVLDAKVNTIVQAEIRVFPLPAFLSYRANLPLADYPLNTLRLPPLNHGGHYLLKTTETGRCFAVRLDIHPELRVTGHVRIALSNPTRPPQRLKAVEQRLDRQELDEALIEDAIGVVNDASTALLDKAELSEIADMLRGLVGE